MTKKETLKSDVTYAILVNVLGGFTLTVNTQTGTIIKSKAT